MKKYRLPRKFKKAEKQRLIIAINNDLAYDERKLSKKEKKSLRFSVWILAGVKYHQWDYRK